MSYTREQLEKMSYAEINVDLHCKILGEPWGRFAEVSDSLKHLCLHDAAGNPYFEDVPDYCNSWEDIMPLAVEYDVVWVKSQLTAFANIDWDRDYFDFSHSYKCDKPQRAIACCLLMMEIGK